MRPLGVLFLTLFTSILGLSILFPVLAPLGRHLGLGETEIGLTSAAYALAQLLFAPFWGRTSERWGRRPVLIVGVIGFLLGFVRWVVYRLGLEPHVGPKVFVYFCVYLTCTLGLWLGFFHR